MKRGTYCLYDCYTAGQLLLCLCSNQQILWALHLQMDCLLAVTLGLHTTPSEAMAAAQEAVAAVRQLVQPHFTVKLARDTVPCANRIGCDHVYHSLWALVQGVQREAGSWAFTHLSE